MLFSSGLPFFTLLFTFIRYLLRTFFLFFSFLFFLFGFIIVIIYFWTDSLLNSARYVLIYFEWAFVVTLISHSGNFRCIFVSYSYQEVQKCFRFGFLAEPWYMRSLKGNSVWHKFDYTPCRDSKSLATAEHCLAKNYLLLRWMIGLPIHSYNHENVVVPKVYNRVVVIIHIYTFWNSSWRAIKIP